MKTIDLDKIRKDLPKRAIVSIVNQALDSYGIEIIIPGESLSEANFTLCKKSQRFIVGEALAEFYTEQEGRHWFIYLKQMPVKFLNLKQ